MKKVIFAAEKIGKNIRYISIFLFSITSLFIAGDLYFKWLISVVPAYIFGAGKISARIAAVCAIAAICYFLLRTLYVKLKKSSMIIPAAVDIFLRDLTAVFRHLHMTFGVAAISFVLMHFYLIFYLSYGFDFNIKTITGFGAFFLIACLAMLGLALFNNLKNKKIRVAHRIVAMIMITALIVHKAFTIFRA